MPDFEVDPEDLRGAASAIAGTVAGVSGLRFGDVTGNGAVYGHAGVSGALEDFCAKKETAVDALRDQAVYHAKALRAAAKSYYEQDHHALPIGGR
ncbi:type VII secretion target [Amycolatopsis sp. H20-H5]|uniref:type VII secretion target n=1 Tax=Amycolatopsis sp. H20-H5 TaxID=3046309 RepID=UPI002DBC6652|nr:type VII secretion target [Amycolatopsis sp. H20-H5]MEC3981464.1 type VII secretion target [Amycolatopsis sp. H20-H5]